MVGREQGGARAAAMIGCCGAGIWSREVEAAAGSGQINMEAIFHERVSERRGEGVLTVERGAWKWGEGAAESQRLDGGMGVSEAWVGAGAGLGEERKKGW